MAGVCVVGWLHAQAAQARGDSPRTLEPRRILALSDSAQSDRSNGKLDFVHELCALPLEYLGLRVDSWDLDHGPPEVDWAQVRGILTVVRRRRAPAWLLPWLERARAEHGVRIVHLGSVENLGAPGAVAQWFARLGLEHVETRVDDPFRVERILTPWRETEYESRPIYRASHVGPHNLVSSNEAWLTTRDRRDVLDQRTPIVTGPWGGLGLDPWVVSAGGANDERRWYLDPFAFFAVAFDTRDLPAPEPFVLNGRRKFLLHIDGDGFESISTVDRGHCCGQVFLERILKRYPLPVTVSVIVASLTDDLRPAQSTDRMRIARKIFARDNVEVASHTVLHPLEWRRQLTPSTPPHTVVWYGSLAGYQHDMVAEVRSSIEFINRYLTTPDKPCRVLLWSGNANPRPDAIREVARSGCVNLNGGVYRWDERFDSVGFVPPSGKQVGGAWQTYCGAANEQVFEGYFTSTPLAFAHLDTTIENTGRPRILKPANVYAHFYSVERPRRLRALARLIERWGLEERTAPVFASDVVAAVRATREGCRIDRRDDGFEFEAFGACRSVRLRAIGRNIDWDRSLGVAGALRAGRSLHVHLSAGDARLVFRKHPQPRPHLVEANHELANFERSTTTIRFVSEAHCRRFVVLGGFAPHDELRVTFDDLDFGLAADEHGRVELRIGDAGSTHVEVRAQ